jgi:hypothetical protein
MNTRRSIVTLGLGLALASILVWVPGSTSSPARAQTNTSGTPTATLDGAKAPRSQPNVPFEEFAIDGRSQERPGVVPRAIIASGINNGDFENGRDGSWTDYASNGWYVIEDNLPVAAHSGSWAAWLGAEHDHISYISQSVTVPSENPTLHYWLWINSDDVCGYDYGWVKINGSSVQTINLCLDDNTGGWAARSVDLSAYAGQPVTLEIRVETDSSLLSHLLIDDVTFTEAGGESLTYIPITLRNYWSGYFEDFNNPHSGWPSGDNDYLRYGFLNGEYQFYVKMKDFGVAISPGPADGRDLYLPNDYRVEVDARQVSAAAGAYGLRFGTGYSSDSYEFYQALVYPPSREFYLYKRMMNGSEAEIIAWTYSPAINQGSGSNHIEVERVGSKIELFINGSEVANISDSSFMGSGRDAGPAVYSYDDVPVDVRFDNFGASPP